MAKTLQLGQVVVTRSVNAEMARNPAFAAVVQQSLERHRHGDWGISKDKELNDAAFANGDDRILSAYTIDPAKGESAGFGDNTLWIITEWDRSVTTVLFPEDY